MGTHSKNNTTISRCVDGCHHHHHHNNRAPAAPKMKRNDFNIVLISAATVLLLTANSCCHAYMSLTQNSNTNSNSIQNMHMHPQNTNLNSSIIRAAQLSPASSVSSSSSSSSSSSFALYARSRRNGQESWSKSASTATDTPTSTSTSTSRKSGRRESRYGVRRRVKSVLERAKKKTGIRNNSEDFLGTSDRSVGVSASESPLFTSTRDVSSSSSNSATNGATAPVTATATTAPAIQKTTPKPRPTRTEPLKTTSTVPNVVADAASIGGLGAVVVDDESGKIDVALDYVPPPVVLNGMNGVNGSNGTDTSLSGSESKITTSTNNNNVVNSVSPQKKKKTSPASTYSPSTIRTKPQAEDILVPAKPTKSKSSTATSSSSSSTRSRTRKITEVDALTGDASAAFSMPPPPLPFTLPKLSPEQNNILLSGERVQFQSDMGREGSGFVAVDVQAPAAVVWECLLDFYSYPQTIPTVRDIQMFTNTHLAQDYYAEKAVDRIKYEDGTLATLKHGVPSVTRAAFTLSKFRLNIAAIHKYRTHPQGDYMIFTLDPACTNVVLRSAKGVWHTQSNPDGRGEDYTRVWLLCELKVSPFLPKWIVDYAAKKAMPRASSWIKPHCEAAAELWFKELDE